MDLINKHRGIVKSVNGDIITIRHRRGGTSKVTVDRGLRYSIGELICYTVDPVHRQITGILPKEQADNIVETAASVEAQVSAIDGFPLEDDQDDELIDPVDRYYGEEVFDHDEFQRQGQAFEKYANNDSEEYREPLREEADYYGDGPEE